MFDRRAADALSSAGTPLAEGTLARHVRLRHRGPRQKRWPKFDVRAHHFAAADVRRSVRLTVCRSVCYVLLENIRLLLLLFRAVSAAPCCCICPCCCTPVVVVVVAAAAAAPASASCCCCILLFCGCCFICCCCCCCSS